MRRSVPPEESLRQAAWILRSCLALGDTMEGVVWLAAQMQSVCAGRIVGEPMAMWQAAPVGCDTPLGNGYVCVAVDNAEDFLEGVPRHGFPRSGVEKEKLDPRRDPVVD